MNTALFRYLEQTVFEETEGVSECSAGRDFNGKNVGSELK